MIGLAFGDIFLQHGEPGHPECRERLDIVMAHLQETGWLDRLNRFPFIPASEAELTWVHEPDYIETVKLYAATGEVPDDPCTYANKATFEAAQMAVGACITAARQSASLEIPRSFCAVRPPGHHAMSNRTSGFCFFNNAALAAEAALRMGLKRVAIVDTDVHHCNGTQEFFYHRSDVLVISVHQAAAYPGTGSIDEVGVEEGAGYNLNLPLPEMACTEHYEKLFQQVIVPSLCSYEPEMIICSVGYDTHFDEPLAEMNLDLQSYHMMSAAFDEVALQYCQGRLIHILEGGYDPDVLARGVNNTLRAMVGETPLVDVAPPIHSLQRERLDEAVECIVDIHRSRLSLS